MFDELTQNHRLVLQTLGCSERHERRENEECSIPWFQRIVVKRGKMLKLHFYLFIFSFPFFIPISSFHDLDISLFGGRGLGNLYF
jgi:hypothetical protein